MRRTISKLKLKEEKIMPPTTKRAMTTNKVLLDGGRVEIRLNDDGTIDEIVTQEPVHVTYEYMDRDTVHMRIGNVWIAIGARIPRNRKRPIVRTGVEDWSAQGKDAKSYGDD